MINIIIHVDGKDVFANIPSKNAIIILANTSFKKLYHHFDLET